VEHSELNEVFHIQGGYTPSKSNEGYWSNGTIPWFRMDDIRTNGRILNSSIQNIHESGARKVFKSNSLIISTTATIGEHALITTDFVANQRFTILSLKDTYKNRVNIKFIFYYCFLLDEWCKNNTTVSSFASVDMIAFKKFPVPLPPLDEQQRIVHILDRFDTLCNDITSGLPAEIKARKQQYEHYRNKLLTFTKKEENYGKYGNFKSACGHNI
jgi:type I restriction enzyme, S subunit